MTHESNNPGIAEHGKSTRFGAPDGPDPREAARTRSSIRAAQRRLARIEINYEQRVEAATLARALGGGSPTITLAQAIAVNRMMRALHGDMYCSQRITEDLEGKLPPQE